MAKKPSLFKRGAWLYSLKEQLTEEEFINKAGGLEALDLFRQFPYVSIVLDREKPILVGHNHGHTISIAMQANGCQQWQTMEWR